MNLNDNAYFLLKVNAEYILEQLGKPWYKKMFKKKKHQRPHHGPEPDKHHDGYPK